MSTWTEVANMIEPAGTSEIHSDDLDSLLMERIAHQDLTAMQQLVGRHYSRISGFFTGLALGKEMPDELTVDTFLTAWDRAADFDRGSPVSIWLLALGNRCLLRSIGARRHQLDLDTGQLGDEGSQVRCDGWSRAEWIRALSCLPVAQRVALELTYHLGHSCGEVAAIMGNSEADVRRLVLFGRRKLYTVAAPNQDEAAETAASLPARSDALGDTGLGELQSGLKRILQRLR